jgi:hypothetical protein
MARKSKPKSPQPTQAVTPPRPAWLDRVALGAIAVVAVSVGYLVIFPAKWSEAPVSAQELEGRTISVAEVKPGPAPPRDFYSLPCTRWVAFRRLWSRYIKEPEPIGEMYTLADGSGYLPAKSWHAAAIALERAKKTSAEIGTGDHPFPISDPAKWPTYAFFQSADQSDASAIVVSQFVISDSDRKALKASALGIVKRTCK